MKIVHIAGIKPIKPASPSKSQKESFSARRWRAIQEEADWQKAILKHSDRIKSIQQRDPEWKPKKLTKSFPNP
jgi:hypothetical protein